MVGAVLPPAVGGEGRDAEERGRLVVSQIFPHGRGSDDSELKLSASSLESAGGRDVRVDSSPGRPSNRTTCNKVVDAA